MITLPVEQLIAEVCEFLVVTKTQAREDAFVACLEQQKDIIMSHLRSSTVTRAGATASLKRLQESPFEFAACSEITSLMMGKVCSTNKYYLGEFRRGEDSHAKLPSLSQAHLDNPLVNTSGRERPIQPTPRCNDPLCSH